MKIGTDGVLLGSVSALYNSAKTLDVGTGCGLIAFMIAQKSDALITGIDLDPIAINVANENLKRNPWQNQIKFIQSSFQEFAEKSNDKFDLIVCNPPFFNNSLKGPGHLRNLARHTISLNPDDLLKGVPYLLNPLGTFLLIAPCEQEKNWVNLAKASALSCYIKILIYPKPGKPPKRIILGFSFGKNDLVEESVTIETEVRNIFTDGYKALTADYYLDF